MLRLIKRRSLGEFLVTCSRNLVDSSCLYNLSENYSVQPHSEAVSHRNPDRFTGRLSNEIWFCTDHTSRLIAGLEIIGERFTPSSGNNDG